jgi:hypothetical protein
MVDLLVFSKTATFQPNEALCNEGKMGNGGNGKASLLAQE